ncbi:hypothetical protein PUNSTDRAFT_85754 [Punctularia strigosozonata HHB-11173 SS5]|uniref:uncharacterized protein n=1 Tax=Punctularia strigosozonata (strain HHB-11173) TaxID=741275 RepID=UPI0004416E1F|nr:uncharacterized protein PUNSTDRAFT_85754 [Punctularia strigosozonata HHB-11173 SS5]EIN09411.1 hypothetical protein PUNSTDRAFT_85754 [Punctularia strigosozonata HHB-11173 SS5]
MYKMNLYEPLSGSLLASATAPSATSKHKTIELFNPTLAVELKYTGSISFRWAFQWEGHEFEWKREECYMIRKPDPPVLIAVTKEPAGRIKTTSVQILDYNINRFDIDDKKGLEIVLLSALLTFSDTSDAYHTAKPEGSPNPPPSAIRQSSGPRPTPPPKPPPKTGPERIAELQSDKGAMVNEVTVEEEGSVHDYASHCYTLLQDEAMLFISIQSSAAEHVSKVLQVVEETKRLRHKAGEEAELHQYVVYDAAPAAKGPRRINLDDDKGKGKEKYEPPSRLTVHLSKIPMPELQPKPTLAEKERDKAKHKGKERQTEKEREKEAKKDAKEQRKAEAKLSKRPSPSPTPGHSRIGSHQANSHQPMPSPAQLNNPGIYVAPPATGHSHSPNAHSSHAHSNKSSLHAAPPPPHRPNSPYADPYSRPTQPSPAPPPQSFYGGGFVPPTGPPPGAGALNSTPAPSSGASAQTVYDRHPSASALVSGWLDKTKSILQSHRSS